MAIESKFEIKIRVCLDELLEIECNMTIVRNLSTLVTTIELRVADAVLIFDSLLSSHA